MPTLPAATPGESTPSRAPSSTAAGALLLAVALLFSIPPPAAAQLTPLGAQLLNECVSAGDCGQDDDFGTAVVTGDFNGDGFDDLAVGVPGETLSGEAEAGAVHVYYGSASGLQLTGDTNFGQGSGDIAGGPEAGDHFGLSLAAADFNGDGRDDLAIGVPDEDLNSGVDVGMVTVVFGSATGILVTGSITWTQGSLPGVSESPEADDRFGFALAAGHLDDTIRAELVIGVPGENPGCCDPGSGKIHILYDVGSTPFALEEEWTQDRTECEGTLSRDEPGDAFGRSLALGDVDGNGLLDILVGHPFENTDFPSEDRSNVGKVTVLRNSATGFDVNRASCFHQETSIVGGNNDDEDRFGFSVASGDFNADGIDEMVIGTPFENDLGIPEHGQVHAIYHFFDDDSPAQSQIWNGSTFHSTSRTNDRLGVAIATGDFDDDGVDDLAMGAPDRDIDGGGSDVGAGEVYVLYGTRPGADDGGLKTANAQRFHQNLPAAMPDAPSDNDHFGFALAAGDFDGNGTDDLAVGVPGENITSGVTNEGLVEVIYGLDRTTNSFGTVEFADSTISVAEDRDFIPVVIQRSNGLIAGTVAHELAGGSANPGDDFSYTPRTESWDAGDTGIEFFPFRPVDDTLDEPNQTAIIDLVDPSTAMRLGTPRRTIVTIVDNDVAGSVQFANPPVFPVLERAGSVVVTVTRSGGAASGVTVLYRTETDGTATEDDDYTPVNGRLTFDAGETTQQIVVPLVDDGEVEPNESILLELFSPQGGATLGTPQDAIVIIIENDLFHDGFESGNTSAWSETVPAP